MLDASKIRESSLLTAFSQISAAQVQKVDFLYIFCSGHLGHCKNELAVLQTDLIIVRGLTAGIGT